MTSTSRYDEPYHWWGPRPAPAETLHLRDLVQQGTIELELATTLWAALGGRQSLTVIGGPSGLGKSTLLHALLPSLPTDTQRLYLRGCYETFAFLDDPHFTPGRSALLVNELSPHLPIYLWGKAVGRTLAAGKAGYQILATAHGQSVVDFLASLTGSPLRLPAQALAAIGLVALVEPVPGGGGRRVTGLWQLSEAPSGVSIDQLQPGDLPGGLSPERLAEARAALIAFLRHDAPRPSTK
ncbi:MAG: hypothetical protein U0075_02775 [Thermomicrobiales bacterium]